MSPDNFTSASKLNHYVDEINACNEKECLCFCDDSLQDFHTSFLDAMAPPVASPMLSSSDGVTYSIVPQVRSKFPAN